MNSQPMRELFNSLHDLWQNGTYSDLTITCGEDKHDVHKAIVCPRSARLDALCSELDKLHLDDDDPQAVTLMLRYLYYLDYPQVNGTGTIQNSVPFHEVQANGAGPAINGHLTNGHVNGDPVHSLTNGDHASEPDTTVEIASLNEKMGDVSKKSKKKKKNKSVSSTFETVEREVTEREAEVESTTASNLAVHAKLYALGSKYEIDGLKTLAAEKFEKEVELHWDTDDFLDAAQEAYSSESSSEDRILKDAVLNALKQHSEILEKKQAQEVIRSLELSFELMMHFKNISGPATNGTVGVAA